MPEEPGWVLAENREKRQPECVWTNPDRYRSMPEIASRAPKPTAQQPPKQCAKDDPPPKARLVSRPRQRANGAVVVTPQAPSLLLKADEVCRLLGGIARRSLSRMEKDGRISSVHLLRHHLYARQDVETLVEGLRKWKP